jgi:K+-sensing histidine kinase KdpD
MDGEVQCVVLDDDPDGAELTRRALLHPALSVAVRTFTDATRALTRRRAHGTRYPGPSSVIVIENQKPIGGRQSPAPNNRRKNMNNVARNETSISWASGINLILGIWLFVAAWAVPWDVHAARSNDLTMGVIVFILAVIRLAARERALVASWLNVLAGVWLIIAPFALHFESNGQRWNSIVAGIVIAILALISSGAGVTRHPTATA